MKSIFAISCLAILTGSAEPIPGVALTNGVSPDKKREVVLEADKGSARYETYELKGDDDGFPAFLIREIVSGKNHR